MKIYLIEFEYKEKIWSKIFIFKMNWFFLKILLENMCGLICGLEKLKNYDFLKNNIKFLIWKKFIM